MKQAPLRLSFMTKRQIHNAAVSSRHGATYWGLFGFEGLAISEELRYLKIGSHTFAESVKIKFGGGGK